jgi:hypothetical protein
MKEPTDTPQELGRTANPQNTPIASDEWPTSEFLAAFKAQAKQDMMDDVVAYIAKRATWLQHQHGDRVNDLITEMVTDALGDTFEGRITWDPLRCPLELHLKSTIRSRLAKQLERAENYEHVDVFEAPEHEVEDAFVRDDKPALTPTKKVSKYVKRFTDELRAQAADDAPVLKIIDLHLQDITDRRHICHMTGMRPADYHNAFRRLKRLADKIPADLRAAARDAIS